MIVIGGSAGAVEVLLAWVWRLPPRLPAAIFIVVHTIPGAHSRLPDLLGRRSALPVRHARNGDAVEPGRILIAPPDQDTLLGAGGVELSPGPTGYAPRPAIDPLFRSAAEAFGRRVCGVVLSGNLADGTAGLRHIVRCGGVALAQDPSEALYPDMPGNALGQVDACRIVPTAQLATTIASIAHGPAPALPIISDPRPPSRIATPRATGEGKGLCSRLTCPDCHGALSAEKQESSVSFRCRAGHRFDPDALLQLQHFEAEKAVWAAIRTLREEAGLCGLIAAVAGRDGTAARHFRRWEVTASRQADLVQTLLAEEPPDDRSAEDG